MQKILALVAICLLVQQLIAVEFTCKNEQLNPFDYQLDFKSINRMNNFHYIGSNSENLVYQLSNKCAVDAPKSSRKGLHVFG